MSALSALPPTVATYVSDFVARSRRRALARAIGLAAAMLLAWALLCCAVDRVSQLPSWPRLALLLLGIAGAAGVLRKPLRASLRRDADVLGAAAEIERHDPRFAQRLVTVVSRLLGPAEHRGSDEILYRLLTDVTRHTETGRGARSMPMHAVVMPWVAFAALAGLTAYLARLPDLGLPRLMVRLALPLVDVEPVTTTSLAVMPGDANVVQSQPLRLEAVARRLPDSDSIWLWMKEDDAAWTQRPMNRLAAPAAAGGVQRGETFAFTLAAVERDFRYYVSGGDAATREYRVRALRRPAVAEFAVRYTYPAYADRPPLTVKNTDGLIEAPAGTTATVAVTATEPLQAALLTVGGEKVLMSRTDRDNVRTATFRITRSGPCELDMISTREVAGRGPAGMVVRALPDRPPLVRMLEAGESLRLNPRDIVPLAYQVLDDYGLEALSVRAQVNGAEPIELPLPLHGDARRQEGTFNFDLATIKLGVGDVVSITLAARDRAGQQAAGEAMQVLLAPRSIDLETHQRIAELESSAQLATLVVEELEATARALDEAQKERGRNAEAEAAAVGRGNRFLTTATDTAVLMRQAVLRSLVRGSGAELSTALAKVVDESHLLTSAAEDLFRSNGIAAGEAAKARLDPVLDRARRARALLKTVAEGERAAAVLADRENLVASGKRARGAEPRAAERIRHGLRRATEELDVSLKVMGLDPAAANLDDQLRAKIGAAEAALKAQRPVEFAAAARDWSAELQKDPLRRLLLDERLAAAAQAEAVRPAGDLLWARDLQRCAQAAARLATDAASDKYAGRVVSPEAPNQFASALESLQREHEMNRRPGDVRPPNEVAAAREAAANARSLMAQWAGEGPGQVAVSTGAPAGLAPGREARLRQRRVEDLALRAGAEAAARDYAAARAFDRQLVQSLAESAASPLSIRPASPDDGSVSPSSSLPSGPPVPPSLIRDARRVERLTAKAEKIDHIQIEQDKLANETKVAASQPPAVPGAEATVSGGGAIAGGPPVAALAGRQRDVAERIAGVGEEDGARAPRASAAGGGERSSLSAADDPNWRGRATATLLRAQEQLAVMPQELTRTHEAAVALRQAAARADAANRDAAAAPPERKAALEMAARQAGRERVEAEDRLRGVALPVAPATVEALAAALAAFEPESTAAREVVSRQLIPALLGFEQAARAGDSAAADRAAGEARASIESVQAELARAQQLFTERDPLVAAKWFARAAADSLSRSPPDIHAAQRRQLDASMALSRAWDRTIHQAAAQRLSLLPSMQSLFGVAVPTSTASARAGDATGDKPAPPPDLASIREWGRLRPRDMDETSAPIRESEPAGYEKALQLYFQRLGQVQDAAN